jgi:Undecaprenyl-phosphate glucose phosphotransferase
LSQWKDNDYSVVRAIFFDKKKYTLMLTDLGSLKLFLHFIYYLGAQIAGGPSRAQLAPSESVAAMSKPEPNAIFDTAAAVFEAISAVPHRAAEPQIECKLSLAALAVAEEPQEPAYSPIVLAGLVRLIEVSLVAAVGFIVYVCYVVPAHGFAWYYFVTIGGIALLAMMAFQVADIYQVQAFRGHEKQYMRLASAWSVVFLIAIGISFFAKAGDQFSRAWLGAFYVLGLFALIAFRRGLFLLVRRWTQEGRLDRRTVVVGCDYNGEKLIRSLAAQRDSDVRVIGAFDDRGDQRSPEICAGVPKLGTVDDLVEFARRTRVDLVIFSLPISAESRILEMLKKLWVLPVDIRLSAHTNKLRYRPRSYSYVGNVPVLDVFDKPIADWDVVMKWLFDKFVGTLALIVALPVMLAVAIAVKLDSRGPILFKQKRFGFNNEPIEIYKFRSMYADQADPAAEKSVTRGDPRVTRVGRFIRKTSLDELPQLFNVIFGGALSLVGPRPHPMRSKVEDRFFDEAVDGYFARHRVKPGITGWAQIHGWRGEINSQEKIQQRVEHDLYYIENWSILLDIYTLAQTPFALARTENAY